MIGGLKVVKKRGYGRKRHDLVCDRVLGSQYLISLSLTLPEEINYVQ